MSKYIILTCLVSFLYITLIQVSIVIGARKAKSEQNINGLNCTNHLQTIDRCSSLATYSFTTSFNKYPLNSIEMKASCERINEGLKCLKVHGKCLTSVSRRSLTSYSNSRSKHSKKLCSNVNDIKTVDFLKAAECIRSKNKTNLMIADERELISSIQMLSFSNTTMKWEERFHQACCAANAYKIKVLKDIKPECTKYETITEEMLDSMIGELLETACPEQKRLDEICVKLNKLILEKDWKAVSLTGAALDLIVALSDDTRT